jgi:hypothetical protein
MIVEGIITTTNQDGSVNVTPLGPRVEQGWQQFILRPFQTSRTFANLVRTRQAVFHITDDVELLAAAAIDRLHHLPPLYPARSIEGHVLADACRWYALSVRSIDDSQPRAEIVADVVDHATQRDFFGFNRAKHAVVEAAILATRTAILPANDIVAQMSHLAVIIDKTGGEAEHRAFQLLREYVHEALATVVAHGVSAQRSTE